MPKVKVTLTDPHDEWWTQCDLPSCELTHDGRRPRDWFNVQWWAESMADQQFLEFCSLEHIIQYFSAMRK